MAFPGFTRYYDPSLSRFLNEDPVGFVGGENFYRYVVNNPISHKDPLGLWQFTIAGGDGLGAKLTFGHNSGQWNWGLYSGAGEGLSFDYDPQDSGGCHKFGANGSLSVHIGVGRGHVYGVVDGTLEDRNDPTGYVEVNFPPIGGIRADLDPNKGLERPHGVFGGGEGIFGGIGLLFHSAPKCDCKEE